LCLRHQKLISAVYLTGSYTSPYSPTLFSDLDLIVVLSNSAFDRKFDTLVRKVVSKKFKELTGSPFSKVSYMCRNPFNVYDIDDIEFFITFWVRDGLGKAIRIYDSEKNPEIISRIFEKGTRVIPFEEAL